MSYEILYGNPAHRLTPEVPDTVELPAWLNPAGLAAPDALEAIRAEAATVEADFITAATAVCESFRRMLIVTNAAYVAANPDAWDDDATDVPSAVNDAVEVATGVDRLEELQGWLTGFIGEGGAIGDDTRNALLQRIGYPVTWDDDLRKACNALVGRGDEA